ncbi:thiamine pyrophosphate-binding protein [Eubacterium ventriosum]|uniref:thiamine pyrophosphate-binding protein n=1 Tax=Eubacterium ventriosum TaxID=39496 RepID=UPI00241EBE17|nr:thiamine pyrophosphate-binding protein [Eubacterium ventriosum]
MAKKVANQLVETLIEAGVKRIYAVTGDSLNEVNEAVRQNEAMKWIHVRHEETGAYAAGAEAQLTGLPGCCAGSSGPGHVHLINGLYDAQRSGAPVLAIASTIPTGEFGTEYFQETNTIKLFSDCSYYNEVATTPQQFPRMLQSALQTATTRKGVSVIGLPGDLAKKSAVNIDSSVHIYPKDSSKPTTKPINPENTNDSATSDAIKRACKKLRIGLDLFYQNRKISNKPNASEELEELYKKYGNGRTSQPQNTIETFKLIFKTPLIQGSRNSYNATVVDAENNEYTLIIWSNKVNELKSRGIFEDLLKASQLRQKFTVKGTLQIYGPKREEQIIFEEVFVKNE